MQMKKEIKEFKLDLFPYKDTYVLKGYDDIYTILDDQIVATGAMLGSQFMEGKLKGESTAYQKKLLDISDLIQVISKVQRTWMYLEPIFSSEDIMKQLPNEGPLFKSVDALWRKTMLDIKADPEILALIDREQIKSNFDQGLETLDEITKKLNDYLEQKRQVFP